MRLITFVFSLFLVLLANPASADEAKAVFAGGCFWCMEPPFDKLDGVTQTLSGFSGGTLENPSYKQVTAGGTGHYEVIEVTYDPAAISYRDLLETYWANVDPLDENGQFCDQGPTYRTAIFYADEQQKELAEESLEKIAEKLDQPIATVILPLDQFYPAEDYHQDYYQKNPAKYKFYRWRCGRDARLEELWGANATKAVDIFN